MSRLRLIRLLGESARYFSDDDKYKETIVLAQRLYERDQFDLCEQTIEGLPSRADLLSSLMDKLKGKSAYRTLRRMQEHTVAEKSFTTLKGLSSLMTHAIISCEQGETRYRMLLPHIAEKINELIYEL